MNKAMLCGTVGRDAELRYTQGGTAVLSFSMATEHRYKKGEEWVKATDWHNIVLFGGLAQYLHPDLTKGAKVTVSGRITQDSYEKNGQKVYTTKINADEVVPHVRSSKGGGTVRSQAMNAPADADIDFGADPDGDIPFDEAPF
jgi:single-strand DNA-binding protein